MTMCCEQRAKNMLDAWTGGDTLRLSRLTSAVPQGPDPWQRPDEQERQELLDGIQDCLIRAAGRGDGPATAVSLRLLRHLASSKN